MKDRSNEVTTLLPLGNRTIDADLVAIDLGSFIEQIRREKLWIESGRNTITVFKTDNMRIVLIALHKGSEMMKNIVTGLINIQVLEGQMLFSTGERSIILGKGQMLALYESNRISIIAQEEVVFLLTLTVQS